MAADQLPTGGKTAGATGKAKTQKAPRLLAKRFDCADPGGSLDLERATAAARGLDLGVVEFEAGPLEGLHVIDLGAIQIEQAGLIDKDLQPIVIVGLIQHVGLVLEGH
jgi:hypothetical protein